MVAQRRADTLRAGDICLAGLLVTKGLAGLQQQHLFRGDLLTPSSASFKGLLHQQSPSTILFGASDHMTHMSGMVASPTVMRGAGIASGMRDSPLSQACGSQAQPLPYSRHILCHRGGAHKEGVLGVQTGPEALRAQLQAGTAAAAVQRSWNGALHAENGRAQ